MYEAKLEYVKPDATLEEKVSPVAPEGKVIWGGKINGYILDKTKKAAIAKLEEIHVGTVKKLMRCSSKRAEHILKEMHEAGELKTKSERYAELYPSVEAIE